MPSVPLQGSTWATAPSGRRTWARPSAATSRPGTTRSGARASARPRAA